MLKGGGVNDDVGAGNGISARRRIEQVTTDMIEARTRGIRDVETAHGLFRIEQLPGEFTPDKTR
ncbi:MAG: hypothetical protein AMXMBFR20_09270 [Planctomycetia bacterium]